MKFLEKAKACINLHEIRNHLPNKVKYSYAPIPKSKNLSLQIIDLPKKEILAIVPPKYKLTGYGYMRKLSVK
jgi:hypothetical protein